MNGNDGEKNPDARVERMQKNASMFGCALYLAAFVVLFGVFLYHLLR
jgi:hypothetical protein